MSTLICFFFFFQAEDGIRDLTVTGVQTCAPPISAALEHRRRRRAGTSTHRARRRAGRDDADALRDRPRRAPGARDRKSTRLNSSHSQISYAVFCLKKKKQ